MLNLGLKLSEAPSNSDRSSAFSSMHDIDFSEIPGGCRSQKVRGGVLNSAFSPRGLTPENSDSQIKAVEHMGHSVSVLSAIERYKQDTERLILERYYALERSVERILHEVVRLHVEALEARPASESPCVVSSLSESASSPDAIAQLGKRMEEAHAQAANDRWITQKVVADGFRSLEATLDREMGRQHDLIENWKVQYTCVHEEKAIERDLPYFRSEATVGTSDETHGNFKQGKVKFQGGGDLPEEKVIPDPNDMEAGTGTELNGIERSSVELKSAKSIPRMSCELGKAVGFVRHLATDLSEGRTTRTQKELFVHQALAAKNAHHSLILKVAQSSIFIGIMETCIILNVVIKAIQMDIDVRRAVDGQGQVEWGYYVDFVFTCIFILEILVRLAAEHCYFFIGRQWRWNFFDTAVVAISIFEIATDGISIGFMRIFRSLRLVRVLKIVRVFRFFRELRLMAVSIASCMVSLFWALVLMFIVILVFAMFVLEGSKNYIRDNPPTNQARTDMVDLYGSFPEAIYSLIQAISGGGDWGYFAAPLLEVSWMYGVGFSLFVSFVTLGMMNILIGIFVENAQQYSQLDRDLVIQEEMSTRKSYMNQLRELFHEMDEDKSGTITYSEFIDCLSHERAKAYLDFLQLNAIEAQGLFMLLDLDENGEVGVEEFVLGCMRLKGAAKSIDAASMMYQTKRLAVKVNELYDYSKESFELLFKRLPNPRDRKVTTFSQVSTTSGGI